MANSVTLAPPQGTLWSRMGVIFTMTALASVLDSHRRGETWYPSEITFGQVGRGLLYFTASAGCLSGVTNLTKATTVFDVAKACVPLAIGGVSLYSAIERKGRSHEECLETAQELLKQTKQLESLPSSPQLEKRLSQLGLATELCSLLEYTATSLFITNDHLLLQFKDLARNLEIIKSMNSMALAIRNGYRHLPVSEIESSKVYHWIRAMCGDPIPRQQECAHLRDQFTKLKQKTLEISDQFTAAVAATNSNRERISTLCSELMKTWKDTLSKLWGLPQSEKGALSIKMQTWIDSKLAFTRMSEEISTLCVLLLNHYVNAINVRLTKSP